MTERLFVSDLDGTLLTKKATLSQYTKFTVNSLIGNGLDFTVASARSIVSIREVVGELDISLPVICYNGAMICQLNQNKYHVVNSIENEFVKNISQDVLTHFGIEPFKSTYYDSTEKLFYPDKIGPREDWFLKERTEAKDSRLTSVKEYDESKHSTICMTYMGTKDKATALYKYLTESYPTLQIYLFKNEYELDRESYWVSILSSTATKGNALNQLKKIASKESHEVTSFGDHLNDVPLFQSSDKGIAVNNAVKKLKDISCKIIGHHQEDSVANYLLAQMK